MFWDDGVYVITAKALATGHGYRFIHLPGAPAATHYPPLWPMLLSIVWRIVPAFPENVRWMKLLNPVLLGAGAAGATLLAIRVARIPRWLAASMVSATVIVAPMLLLSAVLMSEPLCLALAAPALAAATLMVLRGRTSDALVRGPARRTRHPCALGGHRAAARPCDRPVVASQSSGERRGARRGTRADGAVVRMEHRARARAWAHP